MKARLQCSRENTPLCNSVLATWSLWWNPAPKAWVTTSPLPTAYTIPSWARAISCQQFSSWMSYDLASLTSWSIHSYLGITLATSHGRFLVGNMILPLIVWLQQLSRTLAQASVTPSRLHLIMPVKTSMTWKGLFNHNIKFSNLQKWWVGP